MPAWLAVTEQEPVVRSVIDDPFAPPAVQTVGVDVVKTTVRPDVLVALTASGLLARVCVPGLVNVTVWLTLLMANVRGTDAAAA